MTTSVRWRPSRAIWEMCGLVIRSNDVVLRSQRPPSLCPSIRVVHATSASLHAVINSIGYAPLLASSSPARVSSFSHGRRKQSANTRSVRSHFQQRIDRPNGSLLV
jgi:hypothetical protein